MPDKCSHVFVRSCPVLMELLITFQVFLQDASAQVVGEKRYWGPGHALKEKSKKLKR